MELVRLTGIPGSHPVVAVQAMLEYKGIPYVRRDLPTGLHRLLLRVRGFHGRTVPVARIAGRRVEGSRAITRALDELQPERPLLPSDPARRARVEELERWADDEFQHTVRRLAHWGARHDRASLRTFATPSYLPLPPWLVQAFLPLLAPLIRAGFRVSDDEARACLAQLRSSSTASTRQSPRACSTPTRRTRPTFRWRPPSGCWTASTTCGRASSRARPARSPAASPRTTPVASARSSRASGCGRSTDTPRLAR